MSSLIKNATLGLVAGALTFSACSKKGDDSESKVEAGIESSAVTIPDAPDAAMQTILSEFANGNGAILWQAMPSVYQADVNTMVQLAGSKLDAEIYDQSFALIGRLGQVVDKQKAFILGTEMGQRSAEDLANLEAALPAIVGWIETLAASDIASIAGLQAFEGQAFFDTTVSKLTAYGIELSKLAGQEGPSFEDLRSVGVSPVEVTETEATLQITVPGEPAETEKFVKVENRWVPAEMATQWTQGVTEVKAKLEAISPEEISAKKPQFMGVLTMIDGVLTQIESAETQAQFDQAVQGAMMPFMGLMMMSQGFGGGAGTPPPAPVAPLPALPSAP